METFSERREFARFIPREQAFVALPNSGRLGPLRDISLCGVGCEFIVNFSQGKISTVGVAPALPADIFASNKSLYLRNILCRVAYDVYVPEDQPSYRMSITKRRCGLKFEQLNEDHKEHIKHFLENNTVESA